VVTIIMYIVVGWLLCGGLTAIWIAWEDHVLYLKILLQALLAGPIGLATLLCFFICDSDTVVVWRRKPKGGK